MNESEECTETGCPIHFRTNSEGVGKWGYPYLVTYCGEYAVFSDVDWRWTAPSSTGAADLSDLLIQGGFSKEAVVGFFSYAGESFTYVYKVEKGAIMDSPMPVDMFYGKPEDTKAMHTMAVEMVKVRQEI